MSRDRHMTAEYQRAVSEFVSREVIYCVSNLIYSLQQAPDAWRAMDVEEEEMFALAAQEDWETPGTSHIEHDMDRDELIDALEELDVELDTDDEYEVILKDEELRKLLIQEISDWQEFCRENRIDPEQREVYEHWLVTGWLARKLEERGEVVVRNFLGLTIWGRCTTGQSISMDGVIQEIYDELHPEEEVQQA